MIAALSLELGIGANSTVFSVADAALRQARLLNRNELEAVNLLDLVQHIFLSSPIGRSRDLIEPTAFER